MAIPPLLATLAQLRQVHRVGGDTFIFHKSLDLPWRCKGGETLIEAVELNARGETEGEGEEEEEEEEEEERAGKE
jgi:hypothetical protein